MVRPVWRRLFLQMSSEDIERRKRLESAVEDDDWSSVIDGQTKLTEEPKVEEAPTATIIRLDALPLKRLRFSVRPAVVVTKVQLQSSLVMPHNLRRTLGNCLQ